MSHWSARLDAVTEDLDARETRLRERERDIECREKLYDPLYVARETGTLYDELWHLIERTAEVRARIANAQVALSADTIALSKVRATRPESTPFVDPKNMNDDERRAWHRRYMLALERDPNTWANRYRSETFICCARKMGWDLDAESPPQGSECVPDPDEPTDPDLASKSAALAKRERYTVRREEWVTHREGQHRIACDDLERVHAHLAAGGELKGLRDVIRVDRWVPEGW